MSSNNLWELNFGEDARNKFNRELMVEQVSAILLKARPNCPENIIIQIPALARRVEATLFKNAKSLSEYSNRFTLEARMKAIACKSSSSARIKRQRQTPHNSSCDLVKLHNEHKKRAIFDSADESDNKDDLNVVKCIRVSENKKITFNFSLSDASDENCDMPQDDISSESEEDEYDEVVANISLKNQGGLCEGKYNKKNCIKSVYNILNKILSLSVNKLGEKFSFTISIHLSGLQNAIVIYINESTSGKEIRKRKVAEAFGYAISCFLEQREIDLEEDDDINFNYDLCMNRSINNNSLNNHPTNLLDIKKNKLTSMKKEVATGSTDIEMKDDEGDDNSNSNMKNKPHINSDKSSLLLRSPITQIIMLSADCFATHPIYQLELFTIIINLLCHHKLEKITTVKDRNMIGNAINRFVQADPAKAIPILIDRLLKRWPHDCSERQVLFLVQIEACFYHLNVDKIILPQLSKIIICVARCVRHDNWHVVNCALFFSEKLVSFASSFIEKNPVIGRSVAQLLNSIETSGRAHWNVDVRNRARTMATKILNSLPSCS